MSIATELWFKNLYEYKPSMSRRLNEVTRSGASATFDYMAAMGTRIQTEFDELFDGKMRVAIPLASSDDRNLVAIVDALKTEGWGPPRSDLHGANTFPTKMTKQKKRALADEGGEEYEVEVRVASLNLEKTYDFTIPAGPRKGETISKTEKTNMSKAIAKLAKRGKIEPELLNWWRKKQTFYTKDEDGYGAIEEMFAGTHKGDDWRLLISRHPVDVLRMSDIGEISSCHAEGSEYFQCAVQESMGNGLIAYLVKTDKLEEFLRVGDVHMSEAYSLINRTLQHKEQLDAIHKHLNDSEQLGMVLKLLKSQWAGWGSYRDRIAPEAIELVTVDMLRDAVRAKLDNKPWPEPNDLPPPKPLGDFDQQEIFRDRDRNIPGIVANSRLRMRKFFDTASGDFFAVPEDRIYGRSIDRFKTAVREWAWDQQKHLFIEEGDDTMELPRASYLERYGGSYEDTNDGPLLNMFFSMSGQKIDQYGYGNVTHVHDEEGENAFDEMREELEEALNQAQNRADHMGFYAEVEGDDGQPYVVGSADASFSFDIGWEGEVDEDDGYSWPEDSRASIPIPKSWGSDYSMRRELEGLLDDATKAYPGETEWDVELGNGTAGQLEVRFRWQPEGAYDASDFDSFCDDLLDTVDDNYDEIFERMRRALVVNGYIAPNDFDRLADDIAEQSTKLKNWEVIGVDEDGNLDDDGEMWFNFKPDRGAGFAQTTEISLGYLPASIGNTIHALAGVFGEAGQTRPGASRRSVEVYPGVAFMNMLGDELQPLSDAANGYVEAQLDFDFGEKYNRPTYEGIDFGNAQVRFVMHVQQPLVMFKIKVVVEANNSQEEIEGSFKFMQFVDQYPEQIIQAVTRVYESFLENRLQASKKKEAEYLDGTVMLKLKNQLESKWDVQAINGDETAEQVMLVTMFINHNWGNFSKPEKYTAIDQYLRPLWQQSMQAYGSWDNEANTPNQWDMMVRSLLRAWNVANARDYKWGGDFRAGADIKARLQRQMRMSPEESVEAENTLEGLSDEERSNAMDALVRGDREEFVRIIRGSVNEARMGTGRWGFEPEQPSAYRANVHKSQQRMANKKYLDKYNNPAPRRLLNWAEEAGLLDYNAEHNYWIPNVLEEPATKWGEKYENGQTFVDLYSLRTKPESLEEQIDRVDRMLREVEGSRTGRTPIDLRIYKVGLGCVVDLDVAGTDSQIENQIRGIEEVTTVSHDVHLQKSVGARRVFRVYNIKFELYGQQARDTYRDSILVPSLNREVKGVNVVDRGPVQAMDSPLREWGGLGYTAPPYDNYLPTMPTPKVSLDSVLEDWAEGGAQIYDTPMNTNDMQYHVMMNAEDLWKYCSRYYRGNKTDFDGRYKHFIRTGPQMPVYVALGQNGRAKITGNEDLVWFAKQAGLEELPVFFSYQKQV